MTTSILFVLASFILLNITTPASTSKRRNINNLEGKASMAFVFDTTGSMGDDLVEAKYGASQILNTTLSLPNKPLHNYILVPFNDPDVGDAFETTDPDAFQRELDNIRVVGGGDCPEMCIGAIYKAIDICLPHSYIYVFTDASAKDYNLTDLVKTINQEKQSQVVFLLSGECGSVDDRGRIVYDEIADSSSGRVFSIRKTQIEEVLKIIREDIRTDKVNLISARSKDDNSTVTLPVDSKLEEITISVNGKNPSIALTDSVGNQVTDIDTLLDVENALVVEVNQLTPGSLRVDVHSEGPHTLRVTGQSSASYVVGISPKHIIYVNGTKGEQLTRYSTYMYIIAFINGTEQHPSAELSRIELLQVDGIFIADYDLTKNRTNPQIYETPLFEPPAGYFYVKVIGTDENGYEINRLMSAAITGLQPKMPTISMPEVTTGCNGSHTTISCEVDSLIPFSVSWYRQDDPFERVGEERIFPRTARATLEILGVGESDGGNYTCNATNSAGSVTMATFLNVTSCRTEFGNNTYAPCTENGVSNPTISSGIPNTNNASSPYDIAGLIGAGIVVVLEVFCHHWL